MIPEITITCGEQEIFIHSITVRQCRIYTDLMEKDISESVTDALFIDKKIIQKASGNQVPFAELNKADAIEFLVAAKCIHFIMQDIILQKLLDTIGVEITGKRESAFDEYDMENGYEEEQGERELWKTFREIINRVMKIAIRLLNNSYSGCMDEDIVALLEYLKFELDTMNEGQG